MVQPPMGTVTLLFTGIEASTQLLQHLREEYGTVLADQRRLLRESFGRFDGREVDTQGDAFFVAFARAGDAIRARGLGTWQPPGTGTLNGCVSRCGREFGVPTPANDLVYACLKP